MMCRDHKCDHWQRSSRHTICQYDRQLLIDQFKAGYATRLERYVQSWWSGSDLLLSLGFVHGNDLPILDIATSQGGYQQNPARKAEEQM
jgi:hypothetical protein